MIVLAMRYDSKSHLDAYVCRIMQLCTVTFPETATGNMIKILDLV